MQDNKQQLKEKCLFLFISSIKRGFINLLPQYVEWDNVWKYTLELMRITTSEQWQTSELVSNLHKLYNIDANEIAYDYCNYANYTEWQVGYWLYHYSNDALKYYKEYCTKIDKSELTLLQSIFG